MNRVRHDLDLREQLELQEELNTSLRKGRRACLHLNGFIRKLKSVQAMLLMKKDKAKKDVDEYVNRLSECLLEFRSDMFLAVDKILKEKMNDIAMLKYGFEEDIDTLNRLCDETERLVQFDKCLSTNMDREDASKLLKAFSIILPAHWDECEVMEVLKFEFTPAVVDADMSSSIFGHLDVGSNDAEARQATPLKCKPKKANHDTCLGGKHLDKDLTGDNPEAGMKKSVIYCTQSTQTDQLCPTNIATQYPGFHNNLDESSSNHRPQYVAYPQIQQNLEYVTYPYYNPSYAAPLQPSTFPVYHSGSIPHSMKVPVLNPSPKLQTCSYAQPNLGTLYHGQSLYLPTKPTHNNPQLGSNLTQTGSVEHKINKNPACYGKTSEENKSDTVTAQDLDMWSPSDVVNIPLPCGPAPLNVLKMQDLSSVEQNKKIDIGKATNAPTSVDDLVIEDSAIIDAKHQEPVKSKVEKVNENINVKPNTSLNILEKVIDKEEGEKIVKNVVDKDENLDRTVDEDGKHVDDAVDKVKDSKNVNQDKVDGNKTSKDVDHLVKVENLFSRVKGIIRANSDDGVLLRTDETTVLQVDKITPEKTTDYKSIVDVPSVNSEVSHTLSKYGQDLKAKLEGGERIISPLKPLRRPLRLPEVSGHEVKFKTKSTSSTLENEMRRGSTLHLADDAESINKNAGEVIPVKIMTIKQEPADMAFLEASKPETLMTCGVKKEQEENIDKTKETLKQKFENKVNRTQSIGGSTETSWVPGNGSCKIELDDPINLGANTNEQFTLHNTVKMTYKPTPTEKNREQLKAQTNWCKGFLNRRLQTDTTCGPTKQKECTGGIHNGDQTGNIDEGERLKSEMKDMEVCSEVTEDLNNNLQKTEVIQKGNLFVEMKTTNKPSGDTLENSLADVNVNKSSESSVDIESKQLMMTTVDNGDLLNSSNDKTHITNVKQGEKKSTNESSSDKDVTEKVLPNRKEMNENMKKDSSVEKVEEWMVDCKLIKKDVENENVKEDADADKVGKEKSSSEQKASLQNRTRSLKKCVENILGEKPCTTRPRLRSRCSNLGSLQAHWIKHVAGTNIKAKLLFKISGGLHFPIGVTTNSLSEIILTDTGNNDIKTWDREGKFIRKFGSDLAMRRPSAVVVNEFDYIFVKDDICIRMFDKTGNYICDIAKDLFVKPFGLAMTHGNCLLVLDTYPRQPALVHVSQDGQNVWKFPYQPLLSAPSGSKCRFMAVSDNKVIVSDLGLSQIYITSLEGVLHRVIGMYGVGVGDFNQPSGISVDIYGNMVIGDSKNNRIQVYRHDGAYIGLMEPNHGNVRPSGIHLTADNKMVVVNFLHHCVHVYEL